MKREVDELHIYHTSRGLLDVFDRVEEKKDFYHDSFMEEFQRQISPQIASALRVKVSYMKRSDQFVGFPKYLSGTDHMFVHEGVLYLKINMGFRNWSRFTWISCTQKNGEIVDPYNDVTGKDIKIKLVNYLNQEMRHKAHKKLLTRNVGNKERYDEDIKLYNNSMNSNGRIDDWIDFYRKEVYFLE